LLLLPLLLLLLPQLLLLLPLPLVLPLLLELLVPELLVLELLVMEPLVLEPLVLELSEVLEPLEPLPTTGLASVRLTLRLMLPMAMLLPSSLLPLCASP